MTIGETADFWGQTDGGQELKHRGHAEGREEGEALASARVFGALLRVRFGDDDRISTLAGELAQRGEPDDVVKAITTAESLEDLL